jgi:tricorn protease
MALNASAPPPLPPRALADEPSVRDQPGGAGNGVTVSIDFAGLQDRITPLPIDPANYGVLRTAADGRLLLLRFDGVDRAINFNAGGRPRDLLSYEFATGELKPVLEEIDGYELAGHGGHLLFRQQETWHAGPVDDPGSATALALSSVTTWVEPRAEWRQMYREAWRILREYFYASNMHGLEWSTIRDRYAPFVDHLNFRGDLDYLLREMQGELVVGHAYIYPGDQPGRDTIPVGLPGADLAIHDGAYRIEKRYDGESWNPDFTAPLHRLEGEVGVGDYILAVDGQALDASINIYALLAHTVGRETLLTVADDPQGRNRRTVRFRPISYEQEQRLRLRDWVERNRRWVDEASGGRIAYVHMPDTARWGHDYFYRYFYTQWDREGLIIDGRFNDGGFAADELVGRLGMPLLSYWAGRDSGVFASPANIFGPKVMLINETAGSGGDALPHYFRRHGVGQLIGKRTWGGLVGIGYYPRLLDGGRITAPHFAILGPDGEWEVENAGVPPDIEVEQTPALVIGGRDPQLEKALEVVMTGLEEDPQALIEEPPPYPERALE